MARVLVIDDEPTIREVLSDCLAADGHEVHVAAHCTAGLELLEHQAFDVVLADLFPEPPLGVGDPPLVALVHAARGAPILLTTTVPNVDLLDLRSAGVAAILLKPFELDVLFHSLQQALAVPAVPLELIETAARHFAADAANQLRIDGNVPYAHRALMRHLGLVVEPLPPEP
jgi:CheY-like chemotaxis protein